MSRLSETAHFCAVRTRAREADDELGARVAICDVEPPRPPQEGFAHPHLGPGILQEEKARMGRNPATGEAIKIKASKKIAFWPRRTSRKP
jgi:hypothetical protein